MPLFLPKMNSYFLFCFIFTVKASAHEKKPCENNLLWVRNIFLMCFKPVFLFGLSNL